MSDLKPCPFCGGEAQTYCVDTWWVSHACDCLGKYVGTKEYATEAEAIAAWNSRADYHGYEQAAIEAWESIKAWNSRAERTCELTFDGTDGNFGCSECLENIPPLSNYCPSCGAKVLRNTPKCSETTTKVVGE